MWIIADHLIQQPMGILIFIQRHDIGEILFGLGTPYQGQGLMFKAMTSVIEFLKQSQKLKKIETFCATEHLASRQVLEKQVFINSNCFMLGPSFLYWEMTLKTVFSIFCH